MRSGDQVDHFGDEEAKVGRCLSDGDGDGDGDAQTEFADGCARRLRYFPPLILLVAWRAPSSGSLTNFLRQLPRSPRLGPVHLE